MQSQKKWTLLLIQDNESEFNMNTDAFEHFFTKVDKTVGREDALKRYENGSYDIVLSDLSVHPEELGFLKQIKDINEKQCIFAFVAPQDENKLYSIADLGINAFMLTPDQLEAALEAIADFDPYAEPQA